MSCLCSVSNSDSEASQFGVLVIGGEATPDNPVESGLTCFNLTVESDVFKEGVEHFTLSLQTDDECIWLGRDLALVLVQANGGKFI